MFDFFESGSNFRKWDCFQKLTSGKRERDLGVHDHNITFTII